MSRPSRISRRRRGCRSGACTRAGAWTTHDRAAVLASATAFVAPAVGHSWPWRVVEALALGTPVVAAESAVHHEVIADGGVIVHVEDLGEALAQLTASPTPLAQRARVLALDRARAFAWDAAAERVWHLHAEL